MNKIKELYYKYKEITNYLIVGFLTTVIALGTYYVCVLTVLDPNSAIQLQIANIISWIAGVIFAYVTNRRFVFESNNTNILKEVISFIGARVVTLLLDMLTMFMMVTLLGINDKISKLVTQILVIILNYILSKIFVFKKNVNKKEEQKQ